MTQSANEAIALAARNLSRHRLEMMMVIARPASASGAPVTVTGGIELDARLSAELIVTLCVPDSLNQCASGIMLVRGDRIERAGARRSDGGRFDIGQFEAIAELTRGVVVAVAESDGLVWVGAPSLPRRRVDPPELAFLLHELVGS